MKTTHKLLGIFGLMLLLLFSAGCRKSKIGAWEVYRSSKIFICSPEDADYHFGGIEKKYWTDKSCKDLGYTESGSSESSWHFTSPDGETVPGRNGAFWDDYQNGKYGGGGSSSSSNCDLANYNGPIFNTQVDSQCKAAYLYECTGNDAGRQAACQLYYSYQSSWTGQGSFPTCPYCN